jgi:hypothetical protein
VTTLALHDAATRQVDPVHAAEVAWDVLDRYGLALQQCEQADEQHRLTVESVQEALAADAVCWYPGVTGEVLQVSTGQPLAPGWSRAFVERMLAEGDLGNGAFIRHLLDPAAKAMSPWPVSAALVRVQRAHNSWLVAISFHPRRLFQPVDLKVMVLARRLLLNHCQHLEAHDRLRDSLLDLVQCLTAAIEAKDRETVEHFLNCRQELFSICQRGQGMQSSPPSNAPSTRPDRATPP